MTSHMRPNARAATPAAGPWISTPVSRQGGSSRLPAHSWPTHKPPAKATSPSHDH